MRGPVTAYMANYGCQLTCKLAYIWADGPLTAHWLPRGRILRAETKIRGEIEAAIKREGNIGGVTKGAVKSSKKQQEAAKSSEK